MRNIVATAVFLKGNQVLLEKRKENEDNYAGMWTFPGGHLEKGEKPEKALVREMKEELNVKVTKYELIDKVEDIDPTSKNLYKHHVFLCKKWSGRIKGTAEEERVKWIDIEKIPKLKKVSETALRVFELLGDAG